MNSLKVTDVDRKSLDRNSFRSFNSQTPTVSVQSNINDTLRNVRPMAVIKKFTYVD